MGKPSINAPDKALSVLTGSFTANGVSGSVQLYRIFNWAAWGTYSAMLFLERSFDGGSVWFAVDDMAGGANNTGMREEPEDGVLYRLRCGAYVSGTLNYRISQ